MIKKLYEFTVKYKEKYVIWLLKNPKTVYTGIYYLVNKRANYFNAIKSFVNIRQGPLEVDDGYIKWAILEIETFILD